MTAMRPLQRGFTLVELMIAMLISIMLLGGIIGVYTASKRSYQSRDGLSMVQENGRVAIKRLRQGVLHAGYPAYDLEVPVILAGNVPENVTPGADNPGAGGDVLTVVFRATGEVYDSDCLGQAAPEKGVLVANRYFVEGGSLKCEGLGNTQPLADGIERMEVLYGIDTLAAGETPDGVPDRYLTATQLEALPQELWLGVVSLRIALLVSSIQAAKDEIGTPRSYNLLGNVVTEPADLQIRRVFTTTIPLRNRMPQP